MHPTPSGPNQPTASGQMAVAVAITALGVGALALLLSLARTPADRAGAPGAIGQSPANPAAIPFLGDRKTCERSGRTWENNQCLDFEHDPTF
jgi:hypothetical protein